MLALLRYGFDVKTNPINSTNKSTIHVSLFLACSLYISIESNRMKKETHTYIQPDFFFFFSFDLIRIKCEPTSIQPEQCLCTWPHIYHLLCFDKIQFSESIIVNIVDVVIVYVVCTHIHCHENCLTVCQQQRERKKNIDCICLSSFHTSIFRCNFFFFSSIYSSILQLIPFKFLLN